jgi:hypothetical protein
MIKGFFKGYKWLSKNKILTALKRLSGEKSIVHQHKFSALFYGMAIGFSLPVG